MNRTPHVQSILTWTSAACLLCTTTVTRAETSPPESPATEESPPASKPETPATEAAPQTQPPANKPIDPAVHIAAFPAEPTENPEPPKYEKHAFLLTYDMAVPVGDTWKYVGAFSPAGCTFDYRYHFTPRLAVGAVIGWNSFDIKEKGTFVYDNITVTGTQIRSLDVMHFGANFHANILPISSRAVPFVGMDIAAYRTWRVTDFGWWSTGQNDWHFGFAPALGVLLHLPGITVILGSKFQMAVKTGNADSETYVSFNIGVGLD